MRDPVALAAALPKPQQRPKICFNCTNLYLFGHSYRCLKDRSETDIQAWCEDFEWNCSPEIGASE